MAVKAIRRRVLIRDVVVNRKPYDDASNKELDRPQFALVCRSLDTVDINLTVLLDVVFSVERTEI